MTIYALIRDVVEERPEEPSETLAAYVAGRVTVEDLVPLIVDAVKDAKRAIHRATEVAQFDQFRRTHADPPAVSLDQFRPRSGGSLEELRRLMDTPFALGDGHTVTWRDASEQDHARRVGMLVKQREGLDRTISFHLQAIEVLRATGAPCLGAVVEGAA